MLTYYIEILLMIIIMTTDNFKIIKVITIIQVIEETNNSVIEIKAILILIRL